jgi:uncharacterized protein
MIQSPFEINGHFIAAGKRETVDIPIGTFGNHMPGSIPVRVIHGRRTGPVMFVSSVIHGDEIIGVEIVRRLIKSPMLERMRGTLLCVPVVNTFGFISNSRYLPDRRDLNRSFPGGPNTSLAGQLAHVFMTEIVERSTIGIDLHSAATHRVNLPQIRYCGDQSNIKELAKIFGAPVALEAPLRPSSLRQAAKDVGVDVLLYESGEALRFDEYAIRIGVRGILNVMAHIGMIAQRKKKKKDTQSLVSTRSKWSRAPTGGIFRAMATIGDTIRKGDTLGFIADPFGDNETIVIAQHEGVIIGRINLPIVNPGDALFHIAFIPKFKTAEEMLSQIEGDIEADPLFDEDEII